MTLNHNVCTIRWQKMILTVHVWQTTILYRIEETWKLWQKFHDEFIKFDGFLSACEKASRNPKTHGVTLGVARQEMYKYEVSTCNSCYL